LILFLKALLYKAMHPFETLRLTIVRRYIDAQANYIGELYEGNRMIGASCDNMPLNAYTGGFPPSPKICYRLSFLDALPLNTLRVGAIEPKDNKRVQEYIALRRFCTLELTVHNRFIEYVMESKKIC
jgi:hypothetical protein